MREYDEGWLRWNCYWRRPCCCGGGGADAEGGGGSHNEYAAVDPQGQEEGATSLTRSSSVTTATSDVVGRLKVMGLLEEAAKERAALLVENGYTTVKELEALTDEELKEHGGFKPGDLKKVAAFRQRQATKEEDSETQALHTEPERSEPTPQLEPTPHPEPEPARWEHVRRSPPGLTMNNLVTSGSSWAAAVDANGMSRGGALASGALKLLLWHALQPALHFWVFLDAFPALEPVQRVLGCLVAGREALYLVSVLVCTWVNSAFLLVDVGASVRDTGGEGGYTSLFMYVIAPEKFVAFALFFKGGLDIECLGAVAWLGGALLDLCGVAALGAGVGAGNLPPALAAGRRRPRNASLSDHLAFSQGSNCR